MGDKQQENTVYIYNHLLMATSLSCAGDNSGNNLSILFKNGRKKENKECDINLKDTTQKLQRSPFSRFQVT